MPKRRARVRNTKGDRTRLRDWIYGSMLLMVVAIMPIVVRLAIVQSSPELFAMSGVMLHANFFSHYKGWFLGIPAVVVTFYALSDWLTDGYTQVDIKTLLKDPPVIAALVFLLMVLISTIFSSYTHTSLLGTPTRGEGMFTLFAYIIVMFAAMYHVREGRHAKVLMYGFAFSSIIMGLVGISQFAQRDIFTTGFGQWLTTGNAEAGVTSPFITAYGTLYNPNTFGKYTAMATPILLACALVYDGRRWVKPIFFAAGALMLVGVFGSRSLAGFIAISVAVGVVVVTLVCRFVYQIIARRNDEDAPPITGRRIAGWILGVVVIAALCVGLYFVPPVNQRLEVALTRLEAAMRAEPRPIDDIIFDGDRFTVITEGYERFTFVIDADNALPDAQLNWRVYCANGIEIPIRRQIPPTATGGGPAPQWPITYQYNVPDLGRTFFQRFESHFVYRNIALTFHNGRFYSMIPYFELIDATQPPEQDNIFVGVDFVDMSEPVPSMGFEGRGHWGSYRGYLLSRTFPLLASSAVIGSGPDTFIMAFPQHDVVGKLIYLRNPYIPVDKAHNIFLNTWVTTGGISAMALLFLYMHYLLTTFVSIVRSKVKTGSFIFGLRIGLLAGISAFCMGAMATDSTIGSTGVFYVLLGLGYGVNMIVKRLEREEASEAAAK